MPVPIIAAGAAAIAARLAAKKVAQEVAKKAAKAAAAKTAQIAKNSVKVKPAAKPPKLDVVQKLRLKPSRPVGIPLGTRIGKWPVTTVKINSQRNLKTK